MVRYPAFRFLSWVSRTTDDEDFAFRYSSGIPRLTGPRPNAIASSSANSAANAITIAGASSGFLRAALPKGTWDLGVFGGGGIGLFTASYTKYAIFGVHIGRVLTQDHFQGWKRGNFEYAAEFMPAIWIYEPAGKVYGGSFNPIILKWNFTANKKIIPYILLDGSGLVTERDVPVGDTSYFNFMAGGSGGVHIMTGRKQALTLESRWLHISNANLGTYNPQLVSNFMFTVGYTWLK